MTQRTRARITFRQLAEAALSLTASELIKGIIGVSSVVVPLVVSIIGGVWWISAEVSHAQSKLDATAASVAEISAKLGTRDTESAALRDRVLHLEDNISLCCPSLGQQPKVQPFSAAPVTVRVGAK